MYNENNNGINLKDIIIKAVFLVLFVLLIVWLFPKVPNMKAFYSNIFRENIKYMQETAESYYTTDKLPKNVGDSVELTLKEMEDKNIIIPFVDKDGKSCDGKKSFAQITKNKTDYTLTVTLVCPKEKGSLKKTLGCHDYCADCGSLENQFRRAVSSNQTVYSCNNGGTLSGTSCIVSTSSSYKADVEPGKNTLSCPNGGTLNGTTCYLTETYTARLHVVNASVSCPNGGTHDGNGYCVVNANYPATYVSGTSNRYLATEDVNTRYVDAKPTTTSSSYDATAKDGSYKYEAKQETTQTTYTASSTTTREYLSGEYTSASAVRGYTCSVTDKFVCNSSSDCPGVTTVYYGCYKNVTTYSCNANDTRNNTTCTHTEIKYTCPNGGTLSGKTCTVSGTTVYSCPNGGTLDGKKCVINTTTYSCAQGKLNGTQCKITETTYSCPSGGTLDGKYCVTSSNGYYTCPNGGTVSGSTCVKSDKYPADITKATTKYTCDKGGNLSGTICVKNSNYSATVTPGKDSYKCTKGGSLSGDTCVVTTSSSYAATASTKAVTVYEYRWSKEETLDGWTKTGQTRKIEA